jgi:XTP/dITP diphosphohydrolase
MMKTIFFATSNEDKIRIARTICEPAGIVVEPVALHIPEIQSEDPEVIIGDKVQRAYEQLGKPVVVSDDSWNIPALRGFPGPYMKSINHWFKPEDFLRLMHGVADRRIILHQYLAYTNGTVTKIFTSSAEGKIVDEVRGHHDDFPSKSVIALDMDGGKTIAEALEQDPEKVEERYKNHPDPWREFAAWYQRL